MLRVLIGSSPINENRRLSELLGRRCVAVVLFSASELHRPPPGKKETGCKECGGAPSEVHLLIASTSESPMSAGLLTTRTPAAVSAAIFSAAVPLPPAMIAPAWPMRRPSGAV